MAVAAVCPDLNTQSPERTPQPEAAAAERLPPRVAAPAEAHTRNTCVGFEPSEAHPPCGSILVLLGKKILQLDSKFLQLEKIFFLVAH